MQYLILLGVNIDHVATLRQARKTRFPDPIYAAMLAEEAGADKITLHLREDLRHIQVRDVQLMKEVLQTPMNLEMAVTDSMLAFAKNICPEHVCFVPEKRAELTTEGGLDIIAHRNVVQAGIRQMQACGSKVSLFVDPELGQLDAAADMGADAVELHTGCYADAVKETDIKAELERIRQASAYAAKLNLVVNAGHGLHYHNVQPIAYIDTIQELNIGHAIISRAVFTGLKCAIQDMRKLMLEARTHGND